MSNTLNQQKIGFFLLITFGISWCTAIILYLAGIEYGSTESILLLVVFFMWAPAISAIIVQVWSGESIRQGGGIQSGNIRWVMIGWILPVPIVLVTIVVGTFLPGVSLASDYSAFLLEMGLTEEQIDAAMAQLEALPVPAWVVFVGQGLLVGITINSLAAFGEELGWRGVLLTELAPLGFWKLSFITGVIWGLWHAPIIVQGHNFPDTPLLGIAVMTMWAITAAPVYTYLTVRAQSVLAPTVLHGTFNGMAGLSLIYLAGAGNVIIAPVGVAGIVATMIIVLGCVVHDRFLAKTSIISQSSLTPWEWREGNA